ncbi:MAG: hypothetical protein ACP5GU_08860 [Thermoprotei archaeon]
MASREKIDKKDAIAFAIAFIETKLLPIIIFLVVLIIISIILQTLTGHQPYRSVP